MKKHVILGAILSLGIGFFVANNTHAYAQLEYTPSGYTNNMVRFNMAEVDLSANTVLPLISELTSNGTSLNITGSPWFVDTPWYTGMGAVEGNYLVVHGEYKVAWYDYGGNAGEEYFDTVRNTMTQNNLKCVAGDGLANYDGTYTPQVSNYSVRVETIGGTLAPQGRPVYKAIISFDYLQQLSSKKNGGNAFCSWTRNPSDGLIYQAINLSSSHRVYLGYDNTGTTATLKSSLTDALLQQQLNQQQQTYNYLTDTTPPDVNISNLSGSAGWLPAGPVDSILTLPVQLAQGIVNVFTNPSQCTPLNIPLPWVDYTMTLPCVGPLMDQIGFSPIWATIGGIISAFIIYDTLKWLYKFVDDTLTLRENNSGLWGGL